MTPGAPRRYVPSLVLFGALLLLWQVVPPLLRIREYLLPGPVAVVRAALDFSIPWHAHIWITTLEILGGFTLAGLAGVALGVAIAWSATAAVVGAIVGEFVASQAGLGMVIVTAQTNLNTPVAFAALLWISIIGLTLYGAVGLAARAWAPWADTT